MAGGGGKGGGGQATNAALQSDEDIMNRMYRRGYFRAWAKAERMVKRDKVFVNYDKSPAPPKK